MRHGAQNIPMNQQQREQIQREKGIVDFEQAYCCPFDMREIDQAVLKEFRDSYFLQSSMLDSAIDAEEFLYQNGALLRRGQDYAFTNAGHLFFASNPQRMLTTAYIRLLRFDTVVDDDANRGLPTFERSFSGPITKQKLDMRTFFRESGFFKIYQY
jgi:predicted HTH transcriptional regulator